MPLPVVLTFFLVSLVGSAAVAQVWKPTSASVTFRAKMFGTAVKGSFKGFTGQLQFDPATGLGSLTATVDARTVDTDNALRNRHLREREVFFNVEKFPVIRMKSTRLEKTATGYAGTFDLTVKSTTRPVRVPFTFTTEGTKGTFVGTFSFNRKDFDFGGNTLGMSETVSVSLLVNTVTAPSP